MPLGSYSLVQDPTKTWTVGEVTSNRKHDANAKWKVESMLRATSQRTEKTFEEVQSYTKSRAWVEYCKQNDIKGEGGSGDKEGFRRWSARGLGCTTQKTKLGTRRRVPKGFIAGNQTCASPTTTHLARQFGIAKRASLQSEPWIRWIAALVSSFLRSSHKFSPFPWPPDPYTHTHPSPIS